MTNATNDLSSALLIASEGKIAPISQVEHSRGALPVIAVERDSETVPDSV